MNFAIDDHDGDVDIDRGNADGVIITDFEGLSDRAGRRKGG